MRLTLFTPCFTFLLMLILVGCTKNPDTTETPQPTSDLPEIIRFTPSAVFPDDTVRIELKNFKLNYSSDTTAGRSDKVLIGSNIATVQFSGTQFVTVKINGSHRTNKITVIIGRDTAISKDVITINERPGSWQKVTTCPGGSRNYFATYLFGDTAYFGFGSGPVGTVNTFFTDFWKFNLKDTGWQKLFDQAVPSSSFSETVSWQVANKGYISFTSLSGTETWTYNPGARQWLRNAATYPGGLLQQSVSVTNSKVFIGTSKNPANNNKTGFYEYNAVSNSFNYFGDIADTANSPIVNSFLLGDLLYFGIKGEIIGSFYYQTRRFYSLHTGTKTFVRKNDFPELFATWNLSCGFSYKGSGYIINGEKLYKYDSASNSWSRKKDFEGYNGNSLNYYGSFEYNGSLYLFVSNSGTFRVELWKYTE